MVLVEITMVNGDVVKIEANAKDSVQSLRKKLCNVCHIPTAFQRLVMAEAEIDDYRKSLSAYIPKGQKQMSLTLVVTLDVLAGKNRKAICKALEEVGYMAGNNHDWSTREEVRACARADDAHVRCFAIQTFMDAGNKADEDMVNLLLDSTEDEDKDVRGWALQALKQLADEEDDAVIAALFRARRDRDAEIRLWATHHLFSQGRL